ncbi:hypothetical protein KEJ51_01190 [Candidatus Bathyarchaeota archaeon]|nr:hypothetical protein [Candidatus Bathyarchaeota archaeon]
MEEVYANDPNPFYVEHMMHAERYRPGKTYMEGVGLWVHRLDAFAHHGQPKPDRLIKM